MPGATSMLHRDDRPSRSAGLTAGVIAGAAALGVGEFFAGLKANWRSPVVGVADAVIARVPNSVKDFAIEQFGKNDKIALIIGILVFSVIFAAVLGLISRINLIVASAGFVVFAIVGALASQHAATAPASAVLPSVFAGVAGVSTLWMLILSAPTRSTEQTQLDTSDSSAAADDGATIGLARAVGGAATLDRRRFLYSTGGIAVLAAVAAAGGRALRSRFSAAASRAAVVLPRARQPLAPAPAGVSVDVEGVSSFYTPNADFYRIDTAVEVPQVYTEDWELRIHGMVDREVRFTYDDILNRELVEADITLTCVSNTVGGDLLGNARWLGVPLRELLAEAGIDPAADQLVGRSVDGWTSGFPIETLTADDRPALLAVGMNGEPLPLEHGFPARVIVSGLYGYVSATKWITELEVTTFDRFDAYWVEREWDDRAPIKIQTRIDTPRSLGKVSPGTVNVGGVAWSQPIGISKVEVKIDDAEFADAVLADELNGNTWRLWSYPWEGAEPGRHRITVRATDANGQLQTDERADPFPNGASGWMSIFVDVRDN